MKDRNFLNLYSHNFVRVAVAIPKCHIADPESNAKEIIALAKCAWDKGSILATFPELKPGVRFVGNGVILPDSSLLTVPIETINVDSFQVSAFRIYDDNLGQFLQSNKARLMYK